jgi:hypothetical protein
MTSPRSPLRSKTHPFKSVRALPWAEKFIEGLFKDRKENLKMDILKFCALVITLRSKWQFSVTSWGRTVKHNKDVGGVEGSDHLMWVGMDVILEPMEKNLDFEKDAGKIGLMALFEKDHYHLQIK